jgi:hypothetical protein
MSCHRRPRTFTSSRLGSAVGLLLLALSSFLVWGTELASSAEGTTAAASNGDTAFDRDVALAPAAAEETMDDAMARDLDLRRAEEDADSSSSTRRNRSLSTNLPFTDDTTSAPLSAGNPSALSCGGLSTCINGCRSRFYKVTGGVTGGYLAATTCSTAHFAQRLYVWKGTRSDCSTFTCTGTFAACFGFVWFYLGS